MENEEHKLKPESLEKKKAQVQEASRVKCIEKIFMKISDVDREDAMWLKEFCDKHVDGKQFLGIKVIRTVMERLDPLVKNVLTQLNDLNERVATLEEKPLEEEKKLVIPQTQGGRH